MTPLLQLLAQGETPAWSPYAVGAGIGVLSLVGMIGVHTMKRFGIVRPQPKRTVVAANLIGGLVFGVGFGLSGCCPGTALAALGQANWDALAVIAGLLAGSYLFAECSGWIQRHPRRRGDLGEISMAKVFHFMKLPDGVLVLPGHGAGSPCGAGIGDRKVSTIGHEKRNVVRLLLRVGLTRFGGYLAGGMDAWARAGLPMNDLPQQTVHDLAADLEKETNLQLLDVRTEEEFEAGRIDGAKHLFVPEVAGKAAEMMDPSVPVVTYCGSGYRASIAASILQREGFEKVRSVPGSWLAWQAMQQ